MWQLFSLCDFVLHSCSHVLLFVTPQTAASQVSLSITTLGVYSNSCPLSQWCHSIISSSVIPLSSPFQSFPTSGSLPMSQFFASGDQSIGVWASASVLPMNAQGWISLQSKGLSRVLQHHSSKASILQHSAFFTVLGYSKYGLRTRQGKMTGQRKSGRHAP